MKFLNFIAALALILIYLLADLPPSERFNLWAIGFLIPFALAINVGLILLGLACVKKSTAFLIIALVVGSDHLLSTVALKSYLKRSDPAIGEKFTVLNYNVGGFNTGYHRDMNASERHRADSTRSAMVHWILNAQSDILCLQEFGHNPAEKTNILEVFKKSGYNHYFSKDQPRRNGPSFGILILSVYPIVRSGEVLVSKNGFNRVAFADVLIDGDTIRVVNAHLQSMQMKSFHPGFAEDLEHGQKNVKAVLRRLKTGVLERSRQTRELVDFIQKSPYPLICAGDFNEIPYSYSYRMLNGSLKNSFEESGRGFGFTYNGNTLSMLRIDNQFYSAGLRSITFDTVDSIRFTDHFPLKGLYMLPH